MHTVGGLNWYQGQSVPKEYQRTKQTNKSKVRGKQTEKGEVSGSQTI
jgi:hypothetical protein